MSGPYVEAPVEQCIVASIKAWEEAKASARFVEVLLAKEIHPISVAENYALRDFNVGVSVFRSDWSEASGKGSSDAIAAIDASVGCIYGVCGYSLSLRLIPRLTS